MLNVRQFLSSEDGALHLDWVILVVGVIGILLAGMSVAMSGPDSLTDVMERERLTIDAG